MRYMIVLLTASLVTAGCFSDYGLISPTRIPVAGGTMTVEPTIAWNRVPRSALDIAREETWTQNGPLLDTITFIGALGDGEAIAKQQPEDVRKVPVFRADMTPPDLVSMLESYYRIKAGAKVFETASLMPVRFLGQTGMQFDYNYVGADDVRRRGRTMLAVIGDKLYLISLDGTALHYFDAALREFEAVAASASIS